MHRPLALLCPRVPRCPTAAVSLVLRRRRLGPRGRPRRARHRVCALAHAVRPPLDACGFVSVPVDALLASHPPVCCLPIADIFFPLHFSLLQARRKARLFSLGSLILVASLRRWGAGPTPSLSAGPAWAASPSASSLLRPDQWRVRHSTSCPRHVFACHLSLQSNGSSSQFSHAVIVPADPANITSEAQTNAQAGQVRRPFPQRLALFFVRFSSSCHASHSALMAGVVPRLGVQDGAVHPRL